MRPMWQARRLLALLVLSGACLPAPADDSFRRAIHSADVERVIRLSETVADINESTAAGRTALMVVARAGRCGQIEKLLSMGADPGASNENGGTALMFAAVTGDPRCVGPILEAGVDVNARGANGWSALMIAAAKGSVSVTRLLILAGADINTRDVFLWTPLHRSAYENRESVVDLLLESPGIEINARDDQGATALHHAAAMGHTAVAVNLLGHGARRDMPDMEGRTPITYAEEQGHETLVQVLGDINRKLN